MCPSEVVRCLNWAGVPREREGGREGVEEEREGMRRGGREGVEEERERGSCGGLEGGKKDRGEGTVH